MRDRELQSNPLVSLHTHSRYCDGKGEITEYIEAALTAGLSAYGASGHAPLPFPNDYAMSLQTLLVYRAEVRSLQQRYLDRIPVYLGLELDYLPGLSDFYSAEFFAPGLDYAVASVHYVGAPGTDPWVYDASAEKFAAEVERRHQGDARPVLEDYYHRVRLLVEESRGWNIPIIIGHLDRIAIWNRENQWFDPESTWYGALIEDTLATIASSGRVLELNTSGWNKPAAKSNPSSAILARAVHHNIPLIVSADAHRPENVAQHYARAVQVLHEVGCRSIVVPSGGGWHSAPLPR